jgi:hypothetical protein
MVIKSGILFLKKNKNCKYANKMLRKLPGPLKDEVSEKHKLLHNEYFAMYTGLLISFCDT